MPTTLARFLPSRRLLHTHAPAPHRLRAPAPCSRLSPRCTTPPELGLNLCQAAVDDQISKAHITATLLPGCITDTLRKGSTDVLSHLFEQASYYLRRRSRLLRHLLDLNQARRSQDSALILQISLNAMPPRIPSFLQSIPPETDLHISKELSLIAIFHNCQYERCT